MMATTYVYILLMLIAIYSISYVKACSCITAHPQTLFCDADFVMQVRLRGKAENIYRKEEVMEFDERTNSSELAIHRTEVAIKYNVKIKRMFKANDNDFGLNKGSKVTQLYTPPYGGLCGVDLSERTTYLVSGKFSNGKLQIELCTSLIIPWHWVSKVQKKGIKFNYGRNCDCQVVNTRFGTETDSQNTCPWDEFSPSGDCYKRHTICFPDKNSSTGGCKWRRNIYLRKCRKKSGRQIP